MQQKKTKEAVAVLELNAEVFPKSSNVYDSLGEAYMKENDFDRAVKNYGKSLELDPQNSNAIDRLNKLQEQRKESASGPKG